MKGLFVKIFLNLFLVVAIMTIGDLALSQPKSSNKSKQSSQKPGTLDDCSAVSRKSFAVRCLCPPPCFIKVSCDKPVLFNGVVYEAKQVKEVSCNVKELKDCDSISIATCGSMPGPLDKGGKGQAHERREDSGSSSSMQ